MHTAKRTAQLPAYRSAFCDGMRGAWSSTAQPPCGGVAEGQTRAQQGDPGQRTVWLVAAQSGRNELLRAANSMVLLQ